MGKIMLIWELLKDLNSEVLTEAKINNDAYSEEDEKSQAEGQ